MLAIRPPVVAGSFYDIEPERLKRQIDIAIKRYQKSGAKAVRKQPKVAIVPHAGYEYSGWVAAAFYSLLDGDSPKNYIILGPNHAGEGSNFAITNRGLWKTPLGGVLVHSEMSNRLINSCALLKNDFIPHQNERSIEVQLPFLQHMVGEGVKLVPIAVYGDELDGTFLDSCKLVGKAIAEETRKSREEWTVIATTDFSHYVPKNVATRTDNDILKSVTSMNLSSAMKKIMETDADVCGFGPVAIAIAAAKGMGLKRGRLLKYATSADTTGQDDSVVGYASVIF